MTPEQIIDAYMQIFGVREGQSEERARNLLRVMYEAAMAKGGAVSMRVLRESMQARRAS